MDWGVNQRENHYLAFYKYLSQWRWDMITSSDVSQVFCQRKMIVLMFTVSDQLKTKWYPEKIWRKSTFSFGSQYQAILPSRLTENILLCFWRSRSAFIFWTFIFIEVYLYAGFLLIMGHLVVLRTIPMFIVPVVK